MKKDSELTPYEKYLKEIQQLPGEEATRRFSTAVFETRDDGHAIWRHLHETSLP